MREFVPDEEEVFGSPVSATPPSDEVMRGLHAALHEVLEDYRKNGDTIMKLQQQFVDEVEDNPDVDIDEIASRIFGAAPKDYLSKKT